MSNQNYFPSKRHASVWVLPLMLTGGLIITSQFVGYNVICEGAFSKNGLFITAGAMLLVLFAAVVFIFRAVAAQRDKLQLELDEVNQLLEEAYTKSARLQGEIAQSAPRKEELLERLRKAEQSGDRAEKALLEKDRFIQAIAQATPDILYVYDVAECKNVYANKEIFNVLGYTEEEIKAMGNQLLKKLVHPQDLIMVEEQQQQRLTVADNEVFSIEYRIRHKDGNYRWLSSRIVVLYRDEKGNTLQTLGLAQDITQHKLFQEALQKSEARYRSFIESAQDFIHETDARGRFTYVNPEIETTTGYAKEELYQMHYWDLIAPESRQEVQEYYAQQRLSRIPTTYREVPVITGGGRRIWIGQKVTFEFEGDRVVSVRTIARDLTELRMAQQEAQRLQESISGVLDSSLSGIIVFNSVRDEDDRIEDFIFQMLNPSAALLLERDASEMVGKKLIQEFPSFVTEGLFSIFRDVVENDEPHTFEFNLTQDSGHSYWLQMVAVRMRDGLMVTFNDIHERKEAELQVERQREFYETILNSSPTEISVYDPQQSYMFANPAAIPDDKVRQWILGRDDFEYSRYLGKDLVYAQQRQETFERILQERKQLEWEEAVNHNEQPSEYYFRQLSPVFDGQGELRMIISFGVNITERKRIEEELIKTREQALQSMKAKEQFLSTMSHEIRTPMNAVIGMTHLLLQENPRPDQVEHLQLLRFSAENLLVLINDILDFSKIEAGKISFEKIDFSLRDLLDGITQSHILRAEEKGIRLSLRLDPKVHTMLIGDPVRLSQILNNLVSNAVKFTEKGEVSITVNAKRSSKKKIEIGFEVKDTGIGIAEDKIDYVFESFTQASSDTTRKYGGTGLGLSITKKLLQLQGSIITAKSKPGEGTTFGFSLLFTKSSQPETATRQPYSMTTIRSLAHVKLLLVEDNKANQVVASKFLNQWGITPDYAENGVIALERFTAKPYDIILMDLQMPELDGYETTRMIRSMKNEPGHQVPIIALTASAMLDVKDKVYKVGMNDYLTKPFNPNELYQKIARYVINDEPAEEENKEGEEDDLLLADEAEKTTDAGSGPEEVQAAEVLSVDFLNYQYLVEMAPDDKDFRKEMVDIYRDTFRKMQEDYPRALLSKDQSQLRSIHHKIKPTVTMLDILALQQLIEKTELLLTENAISEALEAHAMKVINICDQIIEALQAALEQDLKENN